MLRRTLPARRRDGAAVLRQSGDDVLLLTNGENKTVLGAATYCCMDSQHLFSRLGERRAGGLWCGRTPAGGRCW